MKILINSPNLKKTDVFGNKKFSLPPTLTKRSLANSRST